MLLSNTNILLIFIVVMKKDTLTIIVVAVVIFIAMMMWRTTEGFGQDPTSRVQNGWIAGPKGLYGYDPVDHFADQIAAMNEQNGHSTFYPRLSGGVKQNEYTERYTEGHPPYFKKCRSSADCWEGEKCYVDKCVPATAETYTPGQEKKCKSCMTTEEFERLGM